MGFPFVVCDWLTLPLSLRFKLRFKYPRPNMWNEPITTNQELRNATNQILTYIGFTLSEVDVIVLLTEWPCQQWVLMFYWQGDPVSSRWWCIIDRVTLSVVVVDVLLTGSPCQQWVLMSYWQGHPVSSGVWCLIDHVDRVTLSAVGFDVLLTGSTCSSGCWCIIDRVILSEVGVDVIGYLVYGW